MFKPLIIAGLLSTVSAGSLIAQVRGTLPGPPQKSAAQVVAEYAASANGGDAGAIRTLLYRGCPNLDARRDSIFTGFLQLAATPQRVSDIALYWSGAMEMCNDPRLDAWFRTQVRKTQGPIILLHLTRGLLSHPIPENVAAVKDATFDRTVGDEGRTLVLGLIHDYARLGPRDRVDLLAELYERSGRIPEPYHSSEVWFLKKTPEVTYWRTRMADALVRHPEQPGAIELLQHLGGDVIFEAGGNDAAWVSRFRAALVEMEGDPRAPAELKDGSRKTRQLMDNRRRNQEELGVVLKVGDDSPLRATRVDTEAGSALFAGCCPHSRQSILEPRSTGSNRTLGLDRSDSLP